MRGLEGKQMTPLTDFFHYFHGSMQYWMPLGFQVPARMLRRKSKSCCIAASLLGKGWSVEYITQS